MRPGAAPRSSALAFEEIQRFVLLRSEHGFDKAFELCSSDDPDGNGEEFVRARDESQSDLAEGVVVTVKDLVAMVEQGRGGWWIPTGECLQLPGEGRRSPLERYRWTGY